MNGCSVESVEVLEADNVSTWGGLEPLTFGFMPNALVSLAIRTRHWLPHGLEYWHWQYIYICSKFSYNMILFSFSYSTETNTIGGAYLFSEHPCVCIYPPHNRFALSPFLKVLPRMHHATEFDQPVNIIYCNAQIRDIHLITRNGVQFTVDSYRFRGWSVKGIGVNFRQETMKVFVSKFQLEW